MPNRLCNIRGFIGLRGHIVYGDEVCAARNNSICSAHVHACVCMRACYGTLQMSTHVRKHVREALECVLEVAPTAQFTVQVSTYLRKHVKEVP